MYFVVGGMPEPVLVWTEDQDIKETDRVLSNIRSSLKTSFTADFYDLPRNVASLLIHHLRRYQTLKYIQYYCGLVPSI